MEIIALDGCSVPVVGNFDVVVLGGGPAGVSAAVSAAKNGSKVALVERYGYLGGQATGGLVILLVGLTNGKDRIIKGFCENVIDRLFKNNAAKNISNHVLFDAENLKYTLDSMVCENSIKPYFHSYVSGVLQRGNRVLGVILDGKSGKRIIQAKYFIDATGDADLAKYCDLPFFQEPKEISMPITLGFRVGGIDIDKAGKFLNQNYSVFTNMLKNIGISVKMGGWLPTLNPNEAWLNVSNVENIDITDSDDLTTAEIIARMQIQKIMSSLKKEIDGFENAYLIDSASQIGGRESRRIAGKYYFLQASVGLDFDDTIALAPDYTGLSAGGFVKIPFRCLVSDKIDNVIFAGRCISVSHDLLDMFREIPCCMATGQAAGVAASVFAKDNRKIDYKNSIKRIQKTLLAQGAMLECKTDFKSDRMIVA